MAQVGEVDVGVIREDLAIHPRRGGEDRRLVGREKAGEGLEIDALGGDQGGGADGPRVHQAGAEGEGPVEGARVHEPVVLVQPIPALVHHAARPDGAVGMADRAGAARGAGGIDDIAKAVRLAHVIGAGRQGAHGVERVGVDLGDAGRLGAGDLGVAQDCAWGKLGHHLGDFRRGQLR